MAVWRQIHSLFDSSRRNVVVGPGKMFVLHCNLPGGHNVYFKTVIYWADIISTLKERGRVEDDVLLRNSFAGSRILEMGLNRGIARREQYLSDVGRVINKNRTGVISMHTLRVLLRMRSECLWTCPVHDEDNL